MSSPVGTRPTIVGTFLVGTADVGYTRPWIVSVLLGGAPVELGDVIADVTIRQGRDEVTGSPQASSASLAIHPVDRTFIRAFHVGVKLELFGNAAGVPSWPLFTGYVSDAELDDDQLALTAAGVLANANRVELAVAGWPVEPWSARAARLFASTPFPGVVEPDPTFDPPVHPPQSLDTGLVLFETYASSLANAVGAAIVDSPAGELVAQAIGARPTRAAPVHELDPAIVAWSPKWLQPLDVVNILSVQYGPDDGVVEVTVTDEASIGLYQRRASAIDQTRLQATADASERGRVALARNAYPHWGMRDALVLEPIPDLRVGDRVHLTELPPASPSSSWSPIVEGWTHRITGAPAGWTLELALSDPISSGLALRWQDVDPSIVWQAVPPLEWQEADDPSDLVP